MTTNEHVPGQDAADTPEPRPTPPASPANPSKPREIPREQLDHEKPADPDPDDPASP